ncbi:MAG: adenylosuccinate lyase [Deltaproteobacteria bacterium]|nr:adenylosuccinate lyase [Deltaproteobacteria bacterium]
MIPRYSTPELTALWSEQSRARAWLKVEIACVAAWETRGVIPVGTAARLEQAAVDVDLGKLAARALEIEQTTQHDVIAFLSACEELLGPDARYLHYGMTSSDVVDSAFALLLVEVAALLDAGVHQLREALVRRAVEHKRTPCLGRTHGQAAEPTTFGLKLLSFVAELDRARARLQVAVDDIRYGKLSGAVGNYGNIPPDVEHKTLSSLGLRVEPVATQVVPRDRHAVFFSTLAVIGGCIERFAVEVRHLQRNEVKEAFEPFGKGQRGSSAMPHKKNPILSENLTGLCRLLRSYAGAALEDIALWHERDISHSSVERVIAPDATTALHFALRRATRIVDGLVVDDAAMRRHLDACSDVVFSGGVLLALVERGASRHEAYEWVQQAALGGPGMKDRLKADARVAARLPADALDRLFSLENQLQHVDAIFARVLGGGH